MTNETTNSRPTHRVFAVTKNGKKKFWQPIGALWARADGKGFNQRLDYGRVSSALSVTTRVHLGYPPYDKNLKAADERAPSRR
jgi:hypothetical protein